MRRREFITIFAGAAAWVSLARAQEPRRVIALLSSSSSDTFPGAVAAFVQGLKDTGFVEGNNISIEWRWAEGQYNRLPSLAAELVSRGVAVIVAWDAPAAFAAKAATKTIPIVFATGADPVKTGLVDSFSRPGGNLTGVTFLISMLGPKRLELLSELLPSTSTFALLVNPNNPNVAADAPETEAAANALGRRRGVDVAVFTAEMPEQIAPTMDKAKAWGADALNVLTAPLFSINRRIVIERAAALGLPAIYIWPEMAEEDGLIGYGPRLTPIYRQLARLIVKVLRGGKPEDIPLEEPAKFDLVVNLKTAKALGLTIPESFLIRADKVIE